MADDAGDTLSRGTALTARERRLLARGGGVLMDPPEQLTALQDAVSALEASGIRCALIGGLAVGVRARHPRATMDVDLAVATSVPRDHVSTALTGAGFEARGDHAHSLNFRHRSGEPVQVAFDPGFDAIIERAEPVTVGPVTVHVALAADLIAMKERASADPTRRRSKALRDLADVELLRGDVPDEDEGW